MSLLLLQSGCGEDAPPNDEALDAYLAAVESDPTLESSGDKAAAAMKYFGLDKQHKGDPFAGMDFALEPPLHPGLASGELPPVSNRADVAAQTAATLESDRAAREIQLTQEEWQGRNTWMMWTGGNAAFWDLLARESNGLVDLLKLLDARHIARQDRFRILGLVPEPGMRSEDGSTIAADQSQHLGNKHGLWLDEPVVGYSPQVSDRYANDGSRNNATPDPTVYGYPSGIVGLRLFANPNFDAVAEERWDAERYLNDESYYKDPGLVRPFRVGMACAFCHTSYNPLRPPQDAANPDWENLAANVGNQYFRVGGIFGYDMRESSIIRQLLNTSYPGTIDTSLVATDGSNNPNTMNAIYGVLERIDLSLRAASAREKVSPQTHHNIGTLDGLELGQVGPGMKASRHL